MNLNFRSGFHAAVTFALAISAPPTSASDKLFDWNTLFPSNPTAVQSGGDYAPIGWVERSDWQPAIISNPQHGLFTGLQSRGNAIDRFSPAFPWFTANGHRLDYMFMDIEGAAEATPEINQKIASIIDRIRSDPDPNINSARIGNYGYHPGMFTDTHWFPWPWAPWPEFAERENFYFSSGLNVANPSLYPYAYYITHATECYTNEGARHCFPQGVSPNQRSAMFWAPLEKLSSTKRMLPPGDELIPYVNDYNPWQGYTPLSTQLPTAEDNVASVQHYRLRGADGLYTFVSTMDYFVYRELVGDAWHALDRHFARRGALRILNLATNKRSGIEWSAAQKGNRILAIVSNLNTVAQTASWSGHAQLPLRSPSVANGAHRLFQYQSAYLETDDMQKYTPAQSMDDQGAFSWRGPGAACFAPDAPPGEGNNSSAAVIRGHGFAMQDAFYPVVNPGFESSDRVAYSAWLYAGGGSVGFCPADTCLSIDGAKFTLGAYEAVNLEARPHAWYEAQVAVDSNEATVWVRDVTAGETDFTPLIFGVERLRKIPLPLDPRDFKGWTVVASHAGNAIDNLSVGYDVPRFDENFEWGAGSGSLNTEGWNGPDAARWIVTAPVHSMGNLSLLAAAPIAGSGSIRAWTRAAGSSFEPNDTVVYAARLYGSHVGFAPSTADAEGPYFSMQSTGFRLRESATHGDIYQSTTLPVPDHWYEIQVVVDPARNVSKIYVRDSTLDGPFQQLTFRNETTAGDTDVTEVPLSHTAAWEGWQIYSFDDSSQIDDLKASLYPFVDFSSGGAVAPR